TPMKLKGAWPVRYSADGKYVACPFGGDHDDLRVIKVEGAVVKMHEKPVRAGQIRPMADGSFLLTGWNGVCGGWKCVPTNRELQQVWEKRGESEGSADTNFDPESLLGVWTDYQYVTRVIDLRTGKRLFLIDNSANYEAALISTSSPGRGQNRRA